MGKSSDTKADKPWVMEPVGNGGPTSSPSRIESEKEINSNGGQPVHNTPY